MVAVAVLLVVLRDCVVVVVCVRVRVMDVTVAVIVLCVVVWGAVSVVVAEVAATRGSGTSSSSESVMTSTGVVVVSSASRNCCFVLRSITSTLGDSKLSTKISPVVMESIFGTAMMADRKVSAIVMEADKLLLKVEARTCKGCAMVECTLTEPFSKTTATSSAVTPCRASLAMAIRVASSNSLLRVGLLIS